MSEKYKRILPVLIVAAVVAVVLFWQPNPQTPPEEITRAKLERLITEKAIVQAELTPRPYKDIYDIKGIYQRALGTAKVDFAITTHLNESQVQALLERPAASIAVPKTSARNRFLDLAPTLIIASLVL